MAEFYVDLPLVVLVQVVEGEGREIGAGQMHVFGEFHQIVTHLVADLRGAVRGIHRHGEVDPQVIAPFADGIGELQQTAAVPVALALFFNMYIALENDAGIHRQRAVGDAGDVAFCRVDIQHRVFQRQVGFVDMAVVLHVLLTADVEDVGDLDARFLIVRRGVGQEVGALAVFVFYKIIGRPLVGLILLGRDHVLLHRVDIAARLHKEQRPVQRKNRLFVADAAVVVVAAIAQDGGVEVVHVVVVGVPVDVVPCALMVRIVKREVLCRDYLSRPRQRRRRAQGRIAACRLVRRQKRGKGRAKPRKRTEDLVRLRREQGRVELAELKDHQRA